MPEQDSRVQTDQVSGVFALTPAESKRLIARGVASLPEVRNARQRGRIIIAMGTTNAFVAEEITGIAIDKKYYAAGIISQGLLTETSKEGRSKPFVLVDGHPVDVTLKDALKDFTADDVFIKGANAVDAQGNVGILVADLYGGTIGAALGIVLARGSHLIVPVGLEKMVPSVIDASRRCGILRFKYHLGLSVGLIPVVNATVITEIEALRLLCSVKVTHVASGGVSGSEGSVVLAVEGTEDQVSLAFQLVQGIKGETPAHQPMTSTV